jgi:hypothetical protein
MASCVSGVVVDNVGSWDVASIGQGQSDHRDRDGNGDDEAAEGVDEGHGGGSEWKQERADDGTR